MILYNNTSSKLNQVKEKPFKLEKEIQNIFENNLHEVMGLELVKSEFAIKNAATGACWISVVALFIVFL